jgi:hypothetical protein
VPVFLNILDTDFESLRKGRFRQPHRHANPHTPCGELYQRITARGIEPVEKFGQFLGRGGAGEGGEQLDRLVQTRRFSCNTANWLRPKQACRLRRVADKIAA